MVLGINFNPLGVLMAAESFMENYKLQSRHSSVICKSLSSSFFLKGGGGARLARGIESLASLDHQSLMNTGRRTNDPLEALNLRRISFYTIIDAVRYSTPLTSLNFLGIGLGWLLNLQIPCSIKNSIDRYQQSKKNI